ncbi:MAG: hypothetical protein COT74_02830 [Bdellovibrionales bacterium CG10_big_fil_rev_8_21_14_0_10_45_34]|nr:MAG: hypothetical protein COT74_02830 [Bdellovibrionales bacterium CG10_big_fil_rev_8_21_14_0_10_45_34]
MAKLRVIKERSQNLYVENDLRGLGPDHLLTHSESFAFLAVKTHDSKVIHEAAGHFQCLVSHKQNEQIVLRLENSNGLKPDLLSLFATGIYISSKAPESYLLVSEARVLAAILKDRLNVSSGTKNSVEDMKDFALSQACKDWQPDKGVLGLCGLTQWTLNHAGFPLTPTEALLYFGESDIRDVREYWLSLTQSNAFWAEKVG